MESPYACIKMSTSDCLNIITCGKGKKFSNLALAEALREFLQTELAKNQRPLLQEVSFAGWLQKTVE
jgi:hypothetical protein